ncbi:predicted protein [Coccidioides posadasii str. Silveira]|uniref:Predicted protein n=2 Tax=Coccidioides posadasii TaxID=199306 RepID=E9D199_COCPS|nr:predicted protein [Coccidioides posadasii str. Silveira]KMM72031.1 hypothetical protein CPAG_08330 [Coccidioides posadasii RMSCC 3488]
MGTRQRLAYPLERFSLADHRPLQVSSFSPEQQLSTAKEYQRPRSIERNGHPQRRCGEWKGRHSFSDGQYRWPKKLSYISFALQLPKMAGVMDGFAREMAPGRFSSTAASSHTDSFRVQFTS